MPTIKLLAECERLEKELEAVKDVNLSLIKEIQNKNRWLKRISTWYRNSLDKQKQRDTWILASDVMPKQRRVVMGKFRDDYGNIIYTEFCMRNGYLYDSKDNNICSELISWKPIEFMEGK